MTDTTALRDLLGKVKAKAGGYLSGNDIFLAFTKNSMNHIEASNAAYRSIDAVSSLCRSVLPGWTMTLTVNDEINEDGVVLFRGTSPLFRCKGPLGRAALICIIEALIWEAGQ